MIFQKVGTLVESNSVPNDGIQAVLKENLRLKDFILCRSLLKGKSLAFSARFSSSL